MNLRSVDLNLLVVLETLLEERHVTRAASRLGMTQSAASSALDRCRELMGDALLTRSGNGLQVTRLGQSLRQPLKEILSGIRGLIDRAPAELASLAGVVRVGMGDGLIAAVIAPVYCRLAQTAPGLRIAYTPWRGAFDLNQQLEHDELDLVLSLMPVGPGKIRHLEIVRERYVVAMRRGHPAASCFGIESWLSYPHVLVSSRGELRGAVDDVLFAMGRVRHAAIAVPNFLCALPLLEHSNVIATLPSLSLVGQHEDIVTFAPPIPVDGFALHLAWNQRHDADVAVQHVAGILRDEVRNAYASVLQRNT